MAISKIKTGSITDSAITEDKLGNNAVTTGKISDGTIANADISPSAAIVSSKLVVCTAQQETNAFNISLLGFKMAVNEGLTVFNLVDGVVDEFNDESGTDEAEGSNDLYCASNDYYINSTVATGQSIAAVSAGFSEAAVTEGDTSTAGAAPGSPVGAYTQGSFTVPANITSITFYMYGAGGGGDGNSPGGNPEQGPGGGGGFSTGNLAVTAGQVLYTGGSRGGNGTGAGLGQGPGQSGRRGGGLVSLNSSPLSVTSGETTAPAPSIYAVAGSGGAGSYGDTHGGAGGGPGGHGGRGGQATTSRSPQGYSGGGGDQEQGGDGGSGSGTDGTVGQFLEGGGGGNSNAGNGGAGYYGGGGGAAGSSEDGAGGGGSGYISHPQITSGASQAGCAANVGGQGSPVFSGLPGPSYGGGGAIGDPHAGEPGYVLLTSAAVCASTTSTTIISNAFTATSVPTSSRIVVFEENVATPTLNTDIIASISRDGGSNFTTATLSDSGYVTGASGQRILTGQATISGQPSGQSMRWKLALANNAVKIHGVSLQWA